MDSFVSLVAVVALVLAFINFRRLSRLRERLDEVARNSSVSQAENDDIKQSVDVMKRQMAVMAGGQTLDPVMVREGRLYISIPVGSLEKGLKEDGKAQVLDVRTDQEWQGGHIAGALHIPVEAIENRLNEVPRDGRKLFVICASGGRSSSASEFLANRGFLNVANVEGGMNGWRGKTTQD
ncbi:MAG: rhodanese-like domain-containing protein [Planctomycetota bacterium]|nr:rhodanese-like domain-containing protein [Planctomycetota bacterium]